jgi:hypothetical protein
MAAGAVCDCECLRLPAQVEQEQLLEDIRSVIPDNLLSQLLTTWLQPTSATAQQPSSSAEATAGFGAARAAAAQGAAPAESRTGPLSSCFECCGQPAACIYAAGRDALAAAGMAVGSPPPQAPPSRSASYAAPLPAMEEDLPAAASVGARAPEQPQQPTAAGPSGGPGMASADPGGAAEAARAGEAILSGLGAHGGAAAGAACAPLRDIIHFHRSICASLADFAREARALQAGRELSAATLGSLLERHRFLRAVYVFHSIRWATQWALGVLGMWAAWAGAVQPRRRDRDLPTAMTSHDDCAHVPYACGGPGHCCPQRGGGAVPRGAAPHGHGGRAGRGAAVREGPPAGEWQRERKRKKDLLLLLSYRGEWQREGAGRVRRDQP